MGFGESWLRLVSKGVIVVPVLLLILAFVFLYPGKNLKEKIFKPTPTPTRAVTVENIDLSGEYICKSNDWEGYIKQGKIYIKNTAKQTNFYLYRDDCLYSWKNKEYNGSKVCGLSPYISIFENLSRLKLLNFETIISSFLPNVDSDQTSKKIGEVLQSCSQGTVENVEIFEIPQNVLFKNKQLNQSEAN